MAVKAAIIAAVFLVGGQAVASALLDFNYSGVMFDAGSNTSRANRETIVRSGLFLSPRPDASFLIGGGVNYQSQTVKTDVTEAFSATDYFFGFKWSPSRKNWLWLGANISPYSSATFKETGQPTKTWTGYSWVANATFYYPTTRGLLLGFSFDYYSAQYSKESTSTGSTSTSQSTTNFYPSLSVGYLW